MKTKNKKRIGYIYPLHIDPNNVRKELEHMVTPVYEGENVEEVKEKLHVKRGIRNKWGIVQTCMFDSTDYWFKRQRVR